MGIRIKTLRKTLKLSQRDFGYKIGISDTAVSKLESGERNPSEQTLKSICREFNVCYPWLTKGEGAMFNNTSKTVLDKLKETYDLDDAAVTIIKKFVELPKDKQNVITDFIKSMDDKKGEE